MGYKNSSPRKSNEQRRPIGSGRAGEKNDMRSEGAARENEERESTVTVERNKNIT